MLINQHLFKKESHVSKPVTSWLPVLPVHSVNLAFNLFARSKFLRHASPPIEKLATSSEATKVKMVALATPCHETNAIPHEFPCPARPFGCEELRLERVED